MSESIGKLTSFFSRFPGIGPRQAKRFVYFLLAQENEFTEELGHLISEMKAGSTQCALCFRYFEKNRAAKKICELCGGATRKKGTLLLLEKDIDLETVEKSGVYRGMYFILGGLVPILEKNPGEKIREKELLARITSDPDIKEIICALSAHVEGDHTADYLAKILKPLRQKRPLTFSILGRGFSTGTELEYSDTATLQNAFKNRS